MARTVAVLPEGTRITDYISHYVIALALYRQASDREVLRCLLEGIQ